MRILELLLIFGLVPVLTIHIDDGCDVKSAWEINYKWTQVNIGSWVPHEENSTVLTIEIEIEEDKYPSSFDKIDVYSRGVGFTRRRRGVDKPMNDTEISHLKAGHWANFEFNLDSRYSLMYVNIGKELLFKLELDSLPTKMTMKGSNITVNCPSNSRVWYAEEGKPVVIPLDDQKENELLFFSAKPFLVELVLEERTFPLGWHNGALTMIPGLVKSLPQFEDHQLELVCHANGKKTCDIKIGKNRTIAERDILMSAMPTSLTIKSRQGRFAVIMQDEAPTLSLESNSSVILAVIFGLALAVSVVIICVLVWKLKGYKQQHEDSEIRNGTRESTDEGAENAQESLLHSGKNLNENKTALPVTDKLAKVRGRKSSHRGKDRPKSWYQTLFHGNSNAEKSTLDDPI